MTIRIAVDAMGNDRGAAEIVAGALEARSEAIEPILFGTAGLETHGLELRETTDVIEMHEKPSEVVRAKPDSSLVASVRAVAEGHADAVVSAGNTGAMLAAGLLELRRIPGVMRPAIAVPIQAQRGPSVFLDAGANADARPEHLLQFAMMGAVFAEEILEVANPTVRLLSIGEEREKGNQLALEAHELLAASDLNFQGNTEGRDILRGAADVVVTDGFTGNVVLKTLEGAIQAILERPPHSPGGAAPAHPVRPRHLRRRVSAWSARPRRDRPRQLVARGDRQRHPSRRPRSGARRGRPARCTPAPADQRCMIGAILQRPILRRLVFLAPT